MIKRLIVIPARIDSKRLPGKLLKQPFADGRSLLEHCWMNAHKAAFDLGCDILIATDDVAIKREVDRIGAGCKWFQASGDNGTERMANLAQHTDFADVDVFVNVQADMPHIDPDDIIACARGVANPDEMATLAFKDYSEDRCGDHNVVKVLVDDFMDALYFSRESLPWCADGVFRGFWHHVGVYAYGCNALRDYAGHVPRPLEVAENLEQLRAMEIGMVVSVVECKPTLSVNTEQDLEEAVRQFNAAE